jgi:UDP-N-acetylglucosamine--N-acetylmuramyl-(pentapeptide) pyrophosphoryl-undecaprenol N-acetylglucosamine transferase
MTLLLTGGHLTPALALIEYIVQHEPSTQVLFVGRKFSRTDTKQLSKEQSEVEKHGVTFIPFATGKLSRGSLIQRVAEGWHFFTSIFRALQIVAHHKPDAIVSFGSYVAVPLACAAWMWRIPVVSHEQTRTAGFANSVIARFADVIAISHPESAEYFPAKKTTVTGNLIRTSLFTQKSARPSWLTAPTKPLLYITGGSQGSEVINTTVAQCLPQLLRSWNIIHQCGNHTQSRNYKKELTAVKQTLAPIHRKRYSIREWITDAELSWIYRHSSAIVSRAGANTTEEIARLQIPAILIPLPFSHRDEQTLNAKALSKTGGALLLTQQHLTPSELLAQLELLTERKAEMQRSLAALSFPKNSEQQLFALIQSVVR